MSRGKVGMMASVTLLALSSILLWGAPSAADDHGNAGTISNLAGGEDNLAPAPPVIISAEAADDGESVTVLFGRSSDDADGFQAASGDFTSGGTFVSSNNVAGYLLRRADGVELSAVDTGGDALAVIDPTVQAGQTYVYQAVAFDASGNEGVSVGISVDVGDALPPVPTVEDFQWVVERPYVTLSWNLPDPVEGLEIVEMDIVIDADHLDEPILFTTDPFDGTYTWLAPQDGAYAIALGLRAADDRAGDVQVAAVLFEAPEVITATVTFEATEEEAAAIVNDEELLADFTNAFVRATAQLLGISEDRVVVTNVEVGSLAVDFELLPPDDPEEPDAVSAEEAFVALEEAVESEPETFAESVNEEAAAENPDLEISLAAPVVAEIVQVEIGMGEGFTGDELTVSRTVTNNLDVEDTITLEVSGEGFGIWSWTKPAISWISPERVSTDALTLAAGESGEFDITYSSDTVGDAEGSVSIRSNDPENPGETITLSVSIVDRPPAINVDDTPLAFGVVSVGFSESQSVTIGNDGEADLEVSLLSLGTAFQAAPATITVDAGSSVDVDVTFAPEEDGDATAILVVSSNDPETATVLIDLSGTGDAPEPADIDLRGTALNFGRVGVGDTATRTLVVRNVGEERLTGNLSLAGDATISIESVHVDTDGDFTLDGLSEFDVVVSFAPAEAVSSAATITITSNDADQPELIVEVTGVGLVGEEVCVDNDNPEIIRVSDFAEPLGAINFFDFFAFADRFGTNAGEELYDVKFDISPPGEPDGQVNFFDFFVFADDFGSFCTYTVIGGE